jgi:hypothetical protein
MSSTGAIRAIATTTIVWITLQTPPLFGQGVSVPDSVTFSVRAVPEDRTIDSLTHEATWTLFDILKTKGAMDTRTPEWLFVVGTKELPQDPEGRVVVTITTLHALPKEAIEAGKREEVFYSHLSVEQKAAFPKDGKWVREMVSEEMLYQFGMPIDQEIIITRRASLEEELSQVVDGFTRNHAHRLH